MVGLVKYLMTTLLATSMFSGGNAALFRQISTGARKTTKVIKASNSSVVMSNSSTKNTSVALANQTALSNQTAMAIPKPGTLRICNAYAEGSLTATVGYPKPRVKSSAPAAYKDCVQMTDNFKAGDTVRLFFGKGQETAVYLPYPPYADHATILLVLFGHPGSGKGYDIKMQYFRNLKYPQVAAIDCAPAGTKPVKLTLEHIEPKAKTESVDFDRVGPINPGSTNVLLDGKPASNGQFFADWAESYAIMRIGASEVAIYPPIKSLGSRGQSVAITSLVVVLFSLAAY
jgi:hypothetical protein